MRRYIALAALPVLAACGGATVADPPAPPVLAYEVPAAPAVYVQGDTAVVEVDAGGQTFEVTVASRIILDMAFAPTADGGVRVTTTFRDLQASSSNPMGPPQRVDEPTVEGELVFILGPTGEGTVVSRPEIPEGVRDFISPSVVAATFFPRLPARAVVAGDTWTDTVTIDTDEGDTSIESTSVVTYTAVGDTTVMGSDHLLVRMTAVDERSVEGSQMGMDMAQDLAGSSEGWFLWDPVRRLPAEIVVRSEAAGSMEVSAAPFPLTLNADNTTRIVLQAAGGGM